MFLCTGWTSRPRTMLSCTMAQGSSASSSSKSKSIMSPEIQKLSLKQKKQRCFTREPSFIILISIWASRHPSSHNIVRAVLDRPEYCVVACVQHRDHPGNLMKYISATWRDSWNTYWQLEQIYEMNIGNLKRLVEKLLGLRLQQQVEGCLSCWIALPMCESNSEKRSCQLWGGK